MYDYDLHNVVDEIHLKRVLGAIAPLWSERANEDVLEARVWPRLLSLAEKYWSNFGNKSALSAPVNGMMTPLPYLYNQSFMAQRLQKMVRSMRARGIRSEPITSGNCERHHGCF